MDKKQLKEETKTLGIPQQTGIAAFCVMVGGVLFNMILAVILYGMILLPGVKSIRTGRIVRNSLQSACHGSGSATGQDPGFDDRVVTEDPLHTLHVDLIRTSPAVVTVSGADTGTFQFRPGLYQEMLNAGAFLPCDILCNYLLFRTSLNALAGLVPGDGLSP